MKAVTDNNIISDGGENRRKAFTKATELITLGDVTVLIEGQIFEKVGKRLNDDHKKFCHNTYRIDCSTVGVKDYEGNIVKSLNWVASSESKASNVIILTENTQNYVGVVSSVLKAITPTDFLERVNRAKHLHRSNRFKDLDDALTTVFFIS